MYPRVICYLALLAITGCSSLYNGFADKGPLLADLPQTKQSDEDEKIKPSQLPKASLEEIESSYKAALEVAADADLRHKIQVRLADIEMARSQNRQLEVVEGVHFSQAISLYDELLKQPQTQKDASTDERLLYRLSKAYALDGKSAESEAILAQLVAAHPESNYAAEAEFRRGEQAFNLHQYGKAERSYQQVVKTGKVTPFYLNAVYMQGWSQFKQNKSSEAIDSFTALLDILLPAGTGVEQLDGGKKNLADDTLRVLAYTFAYQEGAPSVTQAYKTRGERPYQALIYGQLADYYLEKKRYKDSADTYQNFIGQFPNNDLGPDYFVRMIEVYKVGGFPSEILPAKEAFVNNYGVNSTYWASKTAQQREPLKVHLKQFLDELSSYYHAQAQQQTVSSKLPVNKRKTAEPQPPIANVSAASLYLKAAAYYAQYVTAFPQDTAAANMTFLMAEAYADAGSMADAVKAYEKVAYEYKDAAKGGEAGYSALIILDQLVKSTQGEAQKQWQAHKTRSAVQFADNYAKDNRAVAGLANATDDLFQRGDKTQALQLAQRVVNWQPAATSAQQKTAWLVIAHTQFDLMQYKEAEEAYRKALALMPQPDLQYKQVSERIAASMFKAAETKVASQNQTAAVEQLLQISAVAPGTDIAIKAQYDAANLLIEMKQWARAEQVLVDFNRRYPQHALAATIAPKLALIYQELQQWDKAADALAIMAKSDANPEARRSSLFLSAELARKSGKTQDAITRYGDYVRQYPRPFDIATEARFQLMELNQKIGDSKAAAGWQKALVDADAVAGSERTARSRFLSASANSQYADNEMAAFNAVRLTAPLKDSIKVKRAAMDKALAAYKQVIDLGVPELTTKANHNIGEIYASLHRDLIKSERPAGLDSLAQEQYELMLEEQATPFKEKAVAMLIANSERASKGVYDEWVKKSFSELAKLMPARFGKQEQVLEVSNGLE
ncbi:MAG TPA: tetratricopeptide repeat protein [Cellvibrionaceae bacterium]